MKRLDALRHQPMADDDPDLGLSPGGRLRPAVALGGGGGREHGKDCGGRKDAAHPPFVSSGRSGAFSLSRVEFVARPEPEPEEREAVALALERLLAADGLPPAYRSRWRAEGIAENLDGAP
jgi:hypothetical protein